MKQLLLSPMVRLLTVLSRRNAEEMHAITLSLTHIQEIVLRHLPYSDVTVWMHFLVSSSAIVANLAKRIGFLQQVHIQDMDQSCCILALESYAGIYYLLLLPREVRCKAMVTNNMLRIVKAVLLHSVICTNKQSRNKRAWQKVTCSVLYFDSYNIFYCASELTKQRF